MDKVANAIEKSIEYWDIFGIRNANIQHCNYEFNMNHAVCTTAFNTDAKAIIAYTESGDTARIVSSFGPGCPVFAITSNSITYRQLGLCWNIIPKLYEKKESIDILIKEAIDKLKEEKLLENGDKIVIAGGNKAIPNLNSESNVLNNIIGGVVQI